MMLAPARRCASTLALLPLLLVVDPAQAIEPDSCWRRAYTAEHLDMHPAQSVAMIEVAFSMFPGEPDTRNAFVRVRFRDGPEVLTNHLFCHRSEAGPGMPDGLAVGSFSCYVDCDGGAFHAGPPVADMLFLRSTGFIVSGGCGEPQGPDETVAESRTVLDEGAAETTYRLLRIPTSACVAADAVP
ncbi:MAG: hypothetical protein ACFBRM_04790 [Pikeienuella sp.]